MDVFWLSAFLDFAPDDHADGVTLWERLTGHPRSASRGEHDEFLTLVPPAGDDCVRIQRLADGPSRVHLDVHVEDPQTAAQEAERLGAATVRDHGYVVMRSPGGFPFCLVSHPASTRPAPTRWSAHHASLLDQLCLDIPRRQWERETRFWAGLTRSEPYETGREFARLPHPPHLPLRILLQRLDDPTGSVSAHLDFSATDRDTEVARHAEAGARVEQRHAEWTVLRGPGDFRYCVTDRPPEVSVPEEDGNH